MSALAARLLGWLIRLYPQDFRRVYEADLVAFFHEDRRHPRYGRGVGGAWRFWRATLVDLAGGALAARRRARRDRATTRVARPFNTRGPGMTHHLINLKDDVRLAARRLRQRPAASLASIAALACGIGAAAATWSLISTVLLSPLAVDRPDRLFVVAIGERSGYPDLDHTHDWYPYVRDGGVFGGVAAGGRWPLLVRVGDEVPVSRPVYFATANLFETLGVAPIRGRGFSADDDRRGAAPVVVVSHRFWQRELGAAPDALGRAIRVGRQDAVIVGVLPASFRGLSLDEPPDLYLPLHTAAEVGSEHTNFFNDGTRRESPTAWIRIVGRLDPEMTTAQALAGLAAIPPRPEWRDRRPQWDLVNVNTAAIPGAARTNVREFTRLLAITVALLLVIGCLTVGMLLLIRTEARRDELAMCLALGASRARLARGVAAEGALLSLAGAVLAVPVAVALFGGIRAYQLPGGIEVDALELAIDGRTLGAAIAGALAATLVIALVASGTGLSAKVADVLRVRAGGTAPVTRRRTRAALVIGQVAVATVLLAGAGVFARSLIAALNLNPGYDTGRLITGGVSLGQYGYTDIRAAAFFDDLQARLTAHPAFQTASVSASLGGMTARGKIVVDGEARQFPSFVAYMAVDERYFPAVGLQVIDGRNFAATDTANTPLVVIVSESLARLIGNGGSALGHRILETSRRMDQPRPDETVIVGVVPDLVTNVTALEPLVIYYAIGQKRLGQARTLMLRAAGDPIVAIREAMSAIRQIDPLVTAPTLTTLRDRLSRQMSAQHFGALVLGALGTIALVLTVLGTYVVAESLAIVRRREMGIRAALGATRPALGALVLRETTRLVGLGLLLGIGLAWLGGDAVRAFLFQVQPFDMTTLAAVCATLLAFALAVSLRPAIGAARVDLASVLREQ